MQNPGLKVTLLVCVWQCLAADNVLGNDFALEIGDETELSWAPGAHLSIDAPAANDEPSIVRIALGLEARSEAEMMAGDLQRAERSARDALEIVSRIRGRLANLDLRQQFGVQQFRANALVTEILMRRHLSEPTQDFDQAAFLAAEQGRAKSLGELLGNEMTATGIAPDLAQKRIELTRKLSELADGSESSDDELARILLELDATDNEIAADSPRVALLDQRTAPSVADIQGLLHDNEVLLLFHFTPWGQYGWSVTQDGFGSYVLADAATDDKLARRAIGNLRAGGEFGNDLDQLGNALVAPFAPLLASKARILLVADGVLNYLPYDMLRAGETAQTLLDTHTVSYLPSVATLAFMRNSSPPTQTDAVNIVALADPVFSATDARLSANAATSDSRPALNRLPLGASEVNEIERALPPGHQLDKILGPDASRAALLDRDLSAASVVHIATHGVTNADRPELSGLTLSRFDGDGSRITGFVGIRDIYQLRLNARLVVLSACENGLGADLGAEGLVGLARAFLFAGSREIVASLWQVQDRSTAELMAHFYTQMLENGLDAPAALRAAKLKIREDRRWRHPYFWAGFTIQGDFRHR